MALAMPNPRKNQRPTSARRTPMSRTLRLVSRNRATSWRCRPKVFTSSAPLMLSVSLMALLISALYSMACRRILRKIRPTRRAGSRNSGSTTTDSRASRHSIEIITASVEISVITLVVMLGRVPVTALWAPTTSLVNREMISPDLVWVKNRSDMRCSWVYISWRRSKMMPSPMRALRYRCPTPMRPLIRGIPIIAKARRFRRVMSPSGSTLSIKSRYSSGGINPNMEVTAMATRMSTT